MNSQQPSASDIVWEILGVIPKGHEARTQEVVTYVEQKLVNDDDIIDNAERELPDKEMTLQVTSRAVYWLKRMHGHKCFEYDRANSASYKAELAAFIAALKEAIGTAETTVAT